MKFMSGLRETSSKMLICTIDAGFFRWYHVNIVWHPGGATGGEGVKVIMAHTKRRFLSGKGMALYVMVAAMLLAALPGFGITAKANQSPDSDYVTDSSKILLAEPDTSISDVEELMMGSDPAEILGDSSLKGYSTLAMFSVIAVDDYDFSELEATKVRGASITQDMEVQVRFLPTDGAWMKLDFEVVDGAVDVVIPSEGQLAIFVKDDVILDENDGDGNDNNGKNPDDAKNDTGKAPQTGDRLPLYLAIGCVALASAAISWRKIKK